MSFPLKAATMAAFALTAFAAAMASDASLAGASADTIPSAIRAPQDSDLTSRPSLDSTAGPAIAGEHDYPASTLAALVADHGSPEELNDEMKCLAGAVYFEAKGESLAGQLAVARVIMNRKDSGRFADSLCGVVYQRGQFSFIRNHAMPAIATAGRAWREAVAIAQIAYNDSWNSLAEGALYFHARRVSPNWGRARVALIDNHVFYR
jgi:spore germination cell wall hydrolase CwlJ-like protein